MEELKPLQRLLVLDDDQNVSFTICAIAQTAGFTTSTAADAEDFFKKFSAWLPTHLVIDLQLPDVDGIDILKRLGELFCDCEIIVTSGLENRVLEAAARIATENGLRVAGILPKPFSTVRLKSLLLDETGSRTTTRGKSTPVDRRLSSAAFVELSTAINNHQFFPFFQPKVDCTTSALVGFECLARWRHPGKGLIMPDHFIPLADRSGLINPMSKQIFSQALNWLAENFAGTDIKLAMNMSARLLADTDFSDWLVSQCSHFGIDPHLIILEVTETSSLANPAQALEYLTQLRIKGFNLSIDDFGVGYSSLIQLARLPFSEMKVDKMFVMTARESLESRKITTAVIGLARALALSVTAEGVEDQWTFELLRDIGCDTAQGYHLGRPMEATKALEWVRAKKH